MDDNSLHTAKEWTKYTYEATRLALKEEEGKTEHVKRSISSACANEWNNNNDCQREKEEK